MVQSAENNVFGNISPRELLDATYKAAGNFQVKAFFEAKDEILEAGKYSELEFYGILDAMIDAETERKLVLETLKDEPPLSLVEIAEKIGNFSPEHVIKDIIYLKEQGFVEEIDEVTTRTITKKVKGEVKEKEIQEHSYKYLVKDLSNDFHEHYLEPISVVFDSGACCQCGWCSSICPMNAITVTAEDLKINGTACIKCGICYSTCPRSFSFEQALVNIKKLDGSLQFSDKIGSYLNTYSATTTKDEIVDVRQDGGVVTSLFEYLLRNKLVDAIIAVKHSDEQPWRPVPVIIDDVEMLYKTGGSKYANSPSLAMVDKAKMYENIAIAGVPCMMRALEKNNLYPSGMPFFKNIKYKIGLFCMESFSFSNLNELVAENFNKYINDITKMNIKEGKFTIMLQSGEEMAVPMKDVQHYARNSCHYCDDLTSTCADISVGSIGSPSGWSSVITRNEKGEAIYNGAIEAGLIESKSLQDVEPGQSMIEKIAETKKNKCLPIVLTPTTEKTDQTS
jgi:coenzyme F420 hydrogenase subunit beta